MNNYDCRSIFMEGRKGVANNNSFKSSQIRKDDFFCEKEKKSFCLIVWVDAVLFESRAHTRVQGVRGECKISKLKKKCSQFQQKVLIHWRVVSISLQDVHEIKFLLNTWKKTEIFISHFVDFDKNLTRRGGGFGIASLSMSFNVT